MFQVFQEWLVALDFWLFHWVNQGLANDFFDVLMPYITNLNNNETFKLIVLPLLLFAWWFKQRKSAIKVFIALVLMAAIADSVSYRVIKSYIHRQRPNNDDRIESILRVPYGPQSPSFPSNHSVTGFALASTLAWFYPPYKLVYWGIAGVIAFSRVYVGVHFASDVIAGALLGLLLALLFRKLILQQLTFFTRR